MDLIWLNNVLEVIPNKPKHSKNIFEISGFPRWETVNSNLLAFYFDKEEEHNFGALFLESLLSLVKVDYQINIDDDFEVLREVYTKNGKYIDLLIKSKEAENLNRDEDEENENSDWAVIIENKIDSDLYNDLAEYWDSINSTNKIGIVLSKNNFDLATHNQSGQCYQSITHQQLIWEVQKNLFNYFSQVNEKHLILLKEYINNIENLYFNNMMDKELSLVLNQFHIHNEQIDKLFKAQTKLLEFISVETFKVFDKHGFKPYSEKKTSHSKHFYKKEDENLGKERYDGFRFWVDLGHTLSHNSFYAIFELHGKENTLYGSKLKEILRSENVFTSMISEGGGGGDNSHYNQIYRIEIPLGLTEHGDFSRLLEGQLEEHFFEHPNDFLNKAVEKLNKLKLTNYTE